MKRRIAAESPGGRRRLAALAAALAAAGCSPPQAPATTEPAGPASAWTVPPRLDSVDARPDVLVLRGHAQPGGRVVLRNNTGAAFAAAADGEGRFEIRVPRPAESLMLFPEAQVGQHAGPAPERLLIVAGGRGPVAALRAGGASRRLDAAPALGAIDSDGRVLLASGRAEAGVQSVSVAVAGGAPTQVRPDREGRWSAALSVADGAGVIVQVDDAAFAYPGDAAPPESGFTAERAGQGWRIGWRAAPGAAQTTWLPDTE